MFGLETIGPWPYEFGLITTLALVIIIDKSKAKLCVAIAMSRLTHKVTHKEKQKPLS